jgi:formate hydrogenlyase subunit 4
MIEHLINAKLHVLVLTFILIIWKMSRYKFNSMDKTLYYICRGLMYEFRPSHLSILIMKFLANMLLNKKKN